MKKFSNDQINRLMEETKEIMNGAAEGKSTREIMAELYVEKLEDKTMEQGLAIADKILESVHSFDTSYMQAREDMDKFLSNFAKSAEKDKSVQERCDYWLRLAASVTTAGIALNDESADRAALIEELKGLSVPAEEATEEKAAELREKAFEAIKNSGVLILGLKESAEELREMESADETAEMLIDLGNRECDTRAIMSMLAYTEVKTGECEDVPVEMTASQITTAVCVGVEEIRIAEGVENGSILVDVASVLLSILGTIVIIDFALALAEVGFAMIPYLFSAFLALPAAVLLVYGLVRLSAKGIRAWNRSSKTVVKTIVKGIKAIGRGFLAVISFIGTRVIPGAVKLAKKMWNGLKSLFGGKKTEGVINVEPEEVVEIVDEDDIEIIDENEIEIIDSDNGNLIATT